MFTITIVDSTNLKQLEAALINTSPLMRDWRNAREDIFNNQFSSELDPENRPLRPLSQRYQAWKNRAYPGRRKRELTGGTYRSHNFTLSVSTLTEEIAGNAVYLQGYLELPLLPDDWTEPTAQTLGNLAEQYIDRNF